MSRRSVSPQPGRWRREYSRRMFLAGALALGTSSLLTPTIATSKTSGRGVGAGRRSADAVAPDAKNPASSRSALGTRVTSSVSQWTIRDFGATGSGDDTQAIQAAFDAAVDNCVIIIPPGTYTYTDRLHLSGVHGVTLVGNGRRSVLRSANPDASALDVESCDGVSVRDLVIEGSASARSQAARANGLNLRTVANASVTSVTIRGVATAGIYVSDQSRSVVVDRCTVEHSYADGLQIVDATDVRVTGSEGINTGDDSFSSIGYEHRGRNQRISFIDCRSVGSNASGIAFEGTDDGYVSGCTVESSGVAGIRVQSAPSYKTLGCTGIQVVRNTLRGCRTRPEVGHASIEVAAGYGDLLAIAVRDNSIWEPLSAPLHSVAYPPYQVDALFEGNTLDGEVIV